MALSTELYVLVELWKYLARLVTGDTIL